MYSGLLESFDIVALDVSGTYMVVLAALGALN
jgi:hypothetical protein